MLRVWDSFCPFSFRRATPTFFFFSGGFRFPLLWRMEFLTGDSCALLTVRQLAMRALSLSRARIHAHLLYGLSYRQIFLFENESFPRFRVFLSPPLRKKVHFILLHFLVPSSSTDSHQGFSTCNFAHFDACSVHFSLWLPCSCCSAWDMRTPAHRTGCTTRRFARVTRCWSSIRASASLLPGK